MFSCGIVSTSVRAWNNVVQKGGHKMIIPYFTLGSIYSRKASGVDLGKGNTGFNTREDGEFSMLSPDFPTVFFKSFFAENVLVLYIHCRGIIDLTTRLNFNAQLCL